MILIVTHITQLAHNEVKVATNLKEQFTDLLHSLLPEVTLDADIEDAINSIYDELTRKLCNIRIQEFLSATKQELTVKIGVNCRCKHMHNTPNKPHKAFNYQRKVKLTKLLLHNCSQLSSLPILFF